MINTFLFSLNAVAPIILVIVVGYIVGKSGIVSKTFFQEANKFVFNIAIPIYLFYSVYKIESFSEINWGLIAIAVGTVLLIFFIAVLFFMVYTKDPGKRGALIQCSFRSNYAIIGIPLAQAMGGDEAVAVAAIISAVGIPTFNILAVITLSIFSYENNKDSISVKGILKSIYKNPLIRGVLLALICLVIRSFTTFRIKDDIPFLYDAIEDLSKIASPLALVVQGGLFEISAVSELFKDISLGAIWRLIITPFIGLTFAYFLASKGIVNIDTASYPALIAFYGSPVAVSSAIMAEAMHSHGTLARQLVVWTNIGSIFTVFTVIMICKSIGML